MSRISPASKDVRTPELRTLIENTASVGILTGEEIGDSPMKSIFVSSTMLFKSMERTHGGMASNFDSTTRESRDTTPQCTTTPHITARSHYLTGVSASASMHLLGVLPSA